jgi:hypothetical protein
MLNYTRLAKLARGLAWTAVIGGVYLAPLARWPEVGDRLPVTVYAADPGRIAIQWDRMAGSDPVLS